ncbi:hypothetical protein [Parachryseolinea silvisoli]|uniref:hypothetical protein n=1 Tax=Parachryseolinea silvisoli TaxID=2873601 RepID=UPI002265E1EF|nr:hypothetical protein [Parachryseolinea silvisoli]MCD9019432.1 hypothetical protein [Parachryseolinea silvisoli]
MRRAAKKVNERFRWSKSEVVENNTYVKMYLGALNKVLATPERQTLYLLSKFFTDAAAEVTRGRYLLANHLFSKGERLMAAINRADHPLLMAFLNNVYNRSKSLFHYRRGETDTAIALIQATVVNNQRLEARGFDFLVFDRVSQYHNLARVYFSMSRPEEGMKVVLDNICFLMTGASPLFDTVQAPGIRSYNKDYLDMRFSLLCQLIFDTVRSYVGEEDNATQRSARISFFNTLAIYLRDFIVVTSDEQRLQDWLTAIIMFYEDNNIDVLTRAAQRQLDQPFFGGHPGKLLTKLVKLEEKAWCLK